MLSTTVSQLSKEASVTARKESAHLGGRGFGYRVQMLLKLGVARIVPTDFYITLDSDVLLTQPLEYADLFREGKVRPASPLVRKLQCSL